MTQRLLINFLHGKGVLLNRDGPESLDRESWVDFAVGNWDSQGQKLTDVVNWESILLT